MIDPFEDFQAESPAARRAVERARVAARHSYPVLIQGEPGTGKLLLGKMMHAASLLANKPWVVADCETIPQDVVVPRLFGHVKRAAPGAGRPAKGLLESAAGGTIWLGDVGRLNVSAQVRLLELLTAGTISREGATTPKPLEVRIIATTDRNLVDHVRAGHFLHGLYYALAVAVVRVPPLRDCPEDLDALVESMIDSLAREQDGQRPTLTPAARRVIREQPWHGNVRELQNVLRRACLWSTQGKIRLEDVQDALDDAQGPHASDVLLRPLGESFRIDEVLGEVESHYLRRALDQTGGNKARAAALLGLNNSTTLSNRMDKHGLSIRP